jgi:hypothetical protein
LRLSFNTLRRGVLQNLRTVVIVVLSMIWQAGLKKCDSFFQGINIADESEGKSHIWWWP